MEPLGKGFEHLRIGLETAGALEAEPGLSHLTLQGGSLRGHQVHQHQLAAGLQAAGQGGKEGQFCPVIGQRLQHQHRERSGKAAIRLEILHAALAPADPLRAQPLAGRGKHFSGGVNGRQLPVGPLGPGLNQLGPGAASGDQHRSPLAASQGGGCQQGHRQSGQAGVARNQLLHDQVVADGG